MSNNGGNNNGGNNNGNNGARPSNSTSTTPTSTVSVPQTAAAGGLTVTQPPSTGAPSYYKIQSDAYITFGWNLTSLYVTPTSLTFIASCSANGNTYPVGPTASPSNVVPANATQIVWNPWEWEQQPGAIPFAEASYVLKVWDERGDGVGVKGGYFSPYAGTQFALYRPQGYTSIADGWTCQGCSAAFEVIDRPANIALFTSLMIVGFTMWNMLRR